ncbi:uncharacterized protein BDZ83DRAFT_387864 [Colletotrichum acutatum]|uniref:Uncharacterized protein n=1 Tax=Glomerella acutata TaxID=27357 RepID=A0AAD8UGQ9_GLOAC|nr:uncharacterized protein BDZ83DRAFT_387864 [Colletotrichum acutatum]KAK1723591.1 hypothetical protein BDZ83DRAFT_387864 [Colletotrichum acutatum]
MARDLWLREGSPWACQCHAMARPIQAQGESRCSRFPFFPAAFHWASLDSLRLSSAVSQPPWLAAQVCFAGCVSGCYSASLRTSFSSLPAAAPAGHGRRMTQHSRARHRAQSIANMVFPHPSGRPGPRPSVRPPFSASRKIRDSCSILDMLAEWHNGCLPDSSCLRAFCHPTTTLGRDDEMLLVRLCRFAGTRQTSNRWQASLFFFLLSKTDGQTGRRTDGGSGSVELPQDQGRSLLCGRL